jgi:hypothetical protein
MHVKTGELFSACMSKVAGTTKLLDSHKVTQALLHRRAPPSKHVECGKLDFHQAVQAMTDSRQFHSRQFHSSSSSTAGSLSGVAHWIRAHCGEHHAFSQQDYEYVDYGLHCAESAFINEDVATIRYIAMSMYGCPNHGL